MATVKQITRSDNPTYQWRCRATGGNADWSSHRGVQLVVSYKGKYILATWPSSFIPGYLSPRTENVCSHENLDANLSRSSINAHQILKITQCPSRGKWINQLRYINMMEYYSTMRKNKSWMCVAAWVDLKGITVSEQNQPRKIPYFIVPRM